MGNSYVGLAGVEEAGEDSGVGAGGGRGAEDVIVA